MVEGALRGEMVQLERLILLEVLDPAWKDHLYAMDQLRDSIGFRSFSQLDPRIEYKREGSRQFEQFERLVRDRVDGRASDEAVMAWLREAQGGAA